MSGVAPATVPDIARDLGLSPGLSAGAILVAFQSLALFVEPPLLAWSERVRARWFSVCALGAVALTALVAAVATGPWTFLLALAAYGPASGCALATAEASLVARAETHRDRILARLGLGAALGDLAVPALLGALAVAGLGWRAALGVCAASAAVLALAHAQTSALDGRPVAREDDRAETPWREAVRVARRARGLLAWSIACALTSLLDETLVAFASIHLAALGASALTRSMALAAWTAGNVAGLAVLERIAGRVDGRRVLVSSAIAASLTLIVLSRTSSALVGAAAFGALGVFGASLHPLSKSRAYEALPERPAIVNAVGSALVPIDIVTPLALALLVERAGTRAAIAALLLAPVGILVATFRTRARSA